MQNLYELRGLVHAAVDQDWSVHQLAHAGFSLNWTPDVRKSFEKLKMNQYRVAEAFGGSRKVGSGVGEDFLKIS